MSTESSRKKLWSIVGALVVVALIGAGLVITGVVGGDDASAGEIFLAPAGDVGPDPYSATPLATAPDPALVKPVTEPVATVTVPQAPSVAASDGGKPGLYGGSLNNAVCDSQQIVQFLGANPAKAAAWVQALNADPQLRFADGRRLDVLSIPEYMTSLTPIVLLQDTRVTNHGFKNNKPTKLQAVLQKGTAVLVDKYGVPRVKCYCGNPLLPAVAAKSKPTYKGGKWADFDPSKVGVVQQAGAPIAVFALTDPKTGTTFNRPAGSQGLNDTPAAGQSSTPTTVPSGVTTTTPTTAAGSPTTVPAGGTAAINGKSYTTAMKLTDCVGITESGDSCQNKDNRNFSYKFTCSDSTTCVSETGRAFTFDGQDFRTQFQAPESGAFTCNNQPIPTTVEIRFSTDANAGIHGTYELRADPVQPNCSSGFLLRFALAAAAA